MKKFLIPVAICIVYPACRQQQSKAPGSTNKPVVASEPATRSYKEVKDSICLQRKIFAAQLTTGAALTAKYTDAITNFWVSSISIDLYANWQHTTWDFNGTAAEPNAGPIACGYFVAIILRDMDCRVNRYKLGVLPSSGIMKSVAPHQKIRNLSTLTYAGFADSLKHFGKGVYLIGLDFHVGFIVNDGTSCWFIHSNYINRKGVSKDPVTASAALKSSKTRWIISLTGDAGFVNRWLKG